MRLSPATVVFLGKIASLASKGELYASPGAILACSYLRNIMVSVRDLESEGGPVQPLKVETLTILAGLKGRAELVTGEKPAILSGTKTFWVNGVGNNEETGEGWSSEPWTASYRVEDIETFRAGLAAACKVAKANDGKFSRVALDGGEFLATDGHRLAILYAGVDAKASIHYALGEAWGKLISAYQKSQGSWWIKTSERGVALVFCHYRQEAMVQAAQLDEDGTGKQPTIAGMRRIAAAQKGGVQVQLPPETAALCRLFETFAVWRNGAVLAWNKECSDNGGVGLIPQKEEPLAILDAKYLLAALPKGRNAPPAILVVAGDVSNILESTIMARKGTPPKLPEDCYEETEEAANDAAA